MDVRCRPILPLLMLAAFPVQARADAPLVGAIRWDAWQDPTGVGVWTDKSLSPAKWHNRLPFFAEVIAPDQVHIDGNHQVVMDQEIAYAARAGIKYWAFVTYPDSYGMSNGLHLYLSSPKKSQINFALNLQGSWLSNDPVAWSGQVTRYVDYFKDPSYQKVAGGRPLVYLLGSPAGSTRFPTAADAHTAFDQLRSASVAAGAGNPYIVYQGWYGPNDAVTMQSIGADAIGAYAVPAGSPDLPYSSLMTQAQNFWNMDKATGSNVVPIASAGWDNRPRYENPPPWDPGGQNYFREPTQSELASHITQAMNWTTANAAASPANTVLTYAWNEHDEGGWLAPTLKADGSIDTSRIDAVGKAIAMATNPLPLSNGSFEATAATPWYRVPAGGLPPSFVWTSGAAEGSYLVAAPGAAHFGAAADGNQALLLSSAGYIAQTLGQATPDTTYYISFSLLTGTYPGDTAGRMSVQLFAGGNVLLSQSFDTPLAAGVWEEHILSVTAATAAEGELLLRFTNQSGMTWVDNVSIGAITVPEPGVAIVIGCCAGLLLRRMR